MREAIRRSSKAIKRKAEVRSSRMRTGILFVSKPTRSELAGSHPECITRDFFLFRIQASSSLIASASPSLAFFAAAAASAASSSGESLCEIRPPRGDHHTAIKGHQGPSRVIKGHPGPSRAIKGHQGRSHLRKIRSPRGHHGHPGPSRAIKGNQGPSRAIKGNQGRSHLREIRSPRGFESFSTGGMVIVSADRSAPSGAASAISFLHSSCFWSFETIVIQPEICLPDVGEIGTRWARWARWARSGRDMLTLDPHLVPRAHRDRDLRLRPRLHHGIHAPVGKRRGRRRGERVHARHGHGSITAPSRLHHGSITAPFTASTHEFSCTMSSRVPGW